MEFLDSKTIKIDKVENELDRFVLDFIRILEKHTKYVIVSGYVSILFGRARGTEDIDMFVEKLDKGKIALLYKELLQNFYYCLNADDLDDIFQILNENMAVRFAKKNTVIPNFELKFAKDTIQKESLENPVKVILPSGSLLISNLEQQIAYKRCCLKSDKDIEDAEHLEKVFEGKLDNNLMLKYKNIFERLWK